MYDGLFHRRGRAEDDWRVRPGAAGGPPTDYINAEVRCAATLRCARRLVDASPGTQYRKALVLPRQETMRPEVLERVMQLVREGAVVLGSAP